MAGPYSQPHNLEPKAKLAWDDIAEERFPSREVRNDGQ